MDSARPCYSLQQVCQRLLDQEGKVIRSIHVLTGLILIAAGGSLFAQSRTVPKEFDHVRTLGRALSEFRDGRIQVAAAYYYSQANHDTPWLLIRARRARRAGDADRSRPNRARHSERPSRAACLSGALGGRFASQLAPAPAGRAVAPPGRLVFHAPRTVRRGSASSRILPSPAPCRRSSTSRRKSSCSAICCSSRRRGLWDEGTYALVIRYDGAEAVLPIELR